MAKKDAVEVEVTYVRVRCVASCYMPSEVPGVKVERYEDYYGDSRDEYNVPDYRVEEFLESGNFVRV